MFKTIPIMLVVWAVAPTALAQEFRKCNVDAVITGTGVPLTVIPGSSFVAWARARDEKRAAELIRNIAFSCLKAALGNYNPVLPNACENRPEILNNRNRSGSAASGFQLTNGLTALKNTICASASIGTGYSRSATDRQYDKRIIEGFRVSYRMRGKTRACRGGTQFWRTGVANIMCKAGTDMPRREKPPFILYKLSKWPQPPACKSLFSVRGTGQTTREAKRLAVIGWITNVTRNYGASFADWKKARAKDIGCVKKLQGKRPVECIAKAKACYF